MQTTNAVFSKEIIKLANGPDQFARRFKEYVINGSKFRTKESEKNRTTQNSGVVLKADTMSYASARDNNPRLGDVIFYGVLTDVVEIRYTNAMKFVLFKCDWVDGLAGMKEDEFKFTLVNFNHLLYRDNAIGDEPFILAHQAKQVCYVQDPVDPDWHVVLNMTVRDLFDMYSKDSNHSPAMVPQVELYAPQQLDETIYMNDEDVGWVREGVDGMTVDMNVQIEEAQMEM